MGLVTATAPARSPCSPKDVPGCQEARSFYLKEEKRKKKKKKEEEKKRTERERVPGMNKPTAFPGKIKASHQLAETIIRMVVECQPPSSCCIFPSYSVN